MDKLKIEYLSVDALTPYDRNTRRHQKYDVEQIAISIDTFGFDDPIGIWGRNNTIVEGHGRLLAAKQLGLKEVPCIRLDHLSDEERRAYAIAHNATAELSEFDFDNLGDELEEVDLSMFDFDLGEEVEEADNEHFESAETTQERVENILNLAKGQYAGGNPFDIPDLRPVYELPEIEEWIGFNYVMSDKNPEGKAVHFFIDDYQFERVWNNPEKYLEKLSRYVCVATPDFSPYGDMPLACQIYNHYRKHWVGAWLQDHGVTVIPTIRCSTDERSLSWYLDGEPHEGIVIMSSMWTKKEENEEIAKEEYRLMKETLNPRKIFIYGGEGNMGVADDDPVEYIKSFTRGRFDGDAEA